MAAMGVTETAGVTEAAAAAVLGRRMAMAGAAGLRAVAVAAAGLVVMVEITAAAAAHHSMAAPAAAAGLPVLGSLLLAGLGLHQGRPLPGQTAHQAQVI